MRAAQSNRRRTRLFAGYSLGVAAAVSVVAVLIGYFGPLVVLEGLVGLAVLIAVVWRPLLVLVVLLVVGQEINPAQGSSGLMVLGSQLYFVEINQLPLMFWVVLVGLIVASVKHLVSRRRQTLTLTDRLVMVLVTALTLWAAGSGLLHGVSTNTSLRHGAMPFILMGMAFLLARIEASAHPNALAKVGGVALFALAAAGAASVFVSGNVFVYYDSATAFCAALAACAIFASRSRGSWMETLVLLSALALLVLSLRRSVILGFGVALALLFLFGLDRSRLSRRVSAVLGVGLLATLFTANSVLGGVFDRFSSSLATLAGTGEDSSTAGHVSDIQVGLQYALENPWGFGPAHPQLPGLLVDQSATIYVHNDFLQVWLMFGVGAVVLLVLLLLLLWRQFAVFARSRSVTTRPANFWAACSASAPVLTVAIFSAPFILTTTRWPLLLGVILAACSVLRPRSVGDTAGNEASASIPSVPSADIVG